MNPPASDAVPRPVLARLRLVCLELPEVVEESAWKPTRGPACVLTFRLAPQACEAERFRRPPFFRPVWFANIAGLHVDACTDWDEVDGLLRDSCRALAPKKLAALVE